MMRIGLGYDVHQLAVGRRLVVGGVEIEYEKGLLGHSDADVLVHAVCDAILGAAGLGDIGQHFPDNEAAYRNIDSLVLLKRSMQMAQENGFCIVNLDATLVAQAPRLAPFRGQMRQRIAAALGADPSLVSIKFTTTEGLGVVGKGKAMAAMCVALLKTAA